jgi:hypothetical protein
LFCSQHHILVSLYDFMLNRGNLILELEFGRLDHLPKWRTVKASGPQDRRLV